MDVFTLSLWENFRWCLIYFDQFTFIEIKLNSSPIFLHFYDKYLYRITYTLAFITFFTISNI